jgi:hypothetical protein
MKKFFVITALLGTATVSNAQQAWPDTTRRNEVGVDVTTFLWQFLGQVSSDGISNYAFVYPTPYWVTYRYHFHKYWNLRFAVGGTITNDEEPGLGGPTTETYTNKNSELDLSIGAERAEELGKRWQIFYGIDFRPAWFYQYNDFIYSNGGYQYGSEQHGTAMAIAPMLGIRYRITPRFSILTEASLPFVSTHNERRDFFKPLGDGYPPMEDQTQTTNGFHTAFTPPLSVIATFDL